LTLKRCAKVRRDADKKKVSRGGGEYRCITDKMKMGRSDLDKLELAPGRPEAGPDIMKNGRPYFDKLGLAIFLKNP
jgi:hypothetical protein